MEKYESFKKWLEQNRPKIILGACFVLVFILGFGTGRYDRENFSKRNSNNQSQNNYTTKTAPKPKEVSTEREQPETKVLGASVDTKDCPIKGNISAQGKKIYHVKGGSFYDRTNPEQCFKTEAEARSFGFVKSSR